MAVAVVAIFAVHLICLYLIWHLFSPQLTNPNHYRTRSCVFVVFGGSSRTKTRKIRKHNLNVYSCILQFNKDWNILRCTFRWFAVLIRCVCLIFAYWEETNKWREQKFILRRTSTIKCINIKLQPDAEKN